MPGRSQFGSARHSSSCRPMKRIVAVFVALSVSVLGLVAFSVLRRDSDPLRPRVDASQKILELARSLPVALDVTSLTMNCYPTPSSGSTATGSAFVVVPLGKAELASLRLFVSGLPRGDIPVKDLGKPRYTDRGSVFLTSDSIALSAGDCRAG